MQSNRCVVPVSLSTGSKSGSISVWRLGVPLGANTVQAEALYAANVVRKRTMLLKAAAIAGNALRSAISLLASKNAESLICFPINPAQTPFAVAESRKSGQKQENAMNVTVSEIVNGALKLGALYVTERVYAAVVNLWRNIANVIAKIVSQKSLANDYAMMSSFEKK